MSIQLDVAQKKLEQEQNKVCKLAGFVNNMNKDDKEAILFAIDKVRADPYFSVVWLTGVLNNNGYTIGKTAVSDHIAGRCACEQAS